MSFTFHEEEYRGCKIRIESDDDPLNPRKEWDNVGTMVCWHRRYNLGDEQPKENPDEYLNDLARKVAKDDDARWLDRACDIAWNARYTHWEQRILDAIDARRRKIIESDIVILPLYLYDHSGITISTGPFSCPWDSGRVGFIYCTLEKALYEWGTKGQEHLGWDGEASFTPKPDGTKRTLREAATAYLEGEVETYDDYLTGQVAVWIAEDPNGETIEAVGGYFPDHGDHSKEWDYPIGEARAAIDRWCDEQDAEKQEAQHWAERDVITVQ